MHRILISTRPQWGHVYPLMPLAEAARDAGHLVEFATAGRFLAKLAAAGFGTHDVGLSVEDGLRELIGGHDTPFPTGPDGRPDPTIQFRLFGQILARATARDLLPVVESHRPDLVVYEQGDFGAGVAAHLAGVPAAAHGLSPRLPGAALSLLSEYGTGPLWAEFGADDPPVDLATGAVYIDPVPAALTPREFVADPVRLPIRPVGWTEPGARLPGWITRSSRRLVYLTLGTAVARGDRLRPAVQALARLDAEVLVALGAAAGDDLGPVPANVHVHDFVDQARLMPHVDLVVHHGGSGTTISALAHGRRQILLPKGADQYTNADLVGHAGLADVLEPDHATPDAIAAAAGQALAAPLPPAVRDVQREIALTPHPRAVLPELLARIAGGTRQLERSF